MNEEALRTYTERDILHGVIRSACKYHRLETDVAGLIVSVCALNSKPSNGGAWTACDLECPMLKMFDEAVLMQARKEQEALKEHQQQEAELEWKEEA